MGPHKAQYQSAPGKAQSAKKSQ